jgi:hypothetical protein
LFKKGVGPQFSMTSFLREYQRIMDNMHAVEDELDHNAINKKVNEKNSLLITTLRGRHISCTMYPYLGNSRNS